MAEREDIEQIFSKELNWIQDKKLKNQVINVWHEAAKRGKWSKLDDAPFTLLIDTSGKLTDHTKRVTNLAKAVYDQRSEKLNLDFLIAVSLK